MTQVRARRLVSPAPYAMAIEEFDLPARPPPSGLLLEAAVTVVSAGTEVANYRGDATSRSATIGSIHYPGYSFAGTVLAVGEHVTAHHPGDRVCTQAPHASHAR
jgi:threonine dehydrogenase-like Zn-dependent dehydrogenase